MDMASVLNCAAEVSTILAFLVMLPGACAASRKRAGEHRRRAHRPRRARPGACAVPADITRRHRGPDRDLRPGPGPACIRRTWPIPLRNARDISGGAGWPAAARVRASRFQLFRSRWQRRIGIHRPELLTGFSADPVTRGVTDRHPNGPATRCPDPVVAVTGSRRRGAAARQRCARAARSPPGAGRAPRA